MWAHTRAISGNVAVGWSARSLARRRGRSQHDRRDEIPLTPGAPWATLPRGKGCHQLGQRQEVLHAKARPPAADAEVGIGGHEIRPVHGHRVQAPDGMLERDPVLAPQRLGDDEPERPPPKGMERMGNPNLRRS
jgi:hypothetical protein